MTSFVTSFLRLYNAVFGAVERALDGWFLGLFARFVFAAVLLLYYLNSATTKVHSGVLGFFSIADNAYYQIVPAAIEAAGYDVANVAFFPWKVLVFFGTYGEFILPILVVLGLLTRLTALGMFGFIMVQTYVDIVFHQIGAEATGAWFDRFPDAVIMDQRLLWSVPLIYLVVKGAGAVSLDGLVCSFLRTKARATESAVPAA